MIRIQSLYPTKLFSKNATDYLYKYDIASLCKKNDIDFYEFTGIYAVVVCNFYICLTYVLRRIPLLKKVLNNKIYWSLKRWLILPHDFHKNIDLIFTNNFIPINDISCPIILEADFVVYGTSEVTKRKICNQLHLTDRQLNKVTRIVVRSSLSVLELKKRNKGFEKKCVVIPHYMPYLNSIEEKCFLEKWQFTKKIKIVFVGNQAKRKGIDFILKLYNENKVFFESNIDFEIVSNFTDGLLDVPKYFNVSKGLNREQVFSKLCNSHIFMLPTNEEAWGKVFVEAMAAGCVTMIPDVYPLNSYFGPGGICYDLMDTKEIFGILKEFSDNSQLMKECAEKSIHYYQDNFDHKIIEKKYCELFSSVIKEKNSNIL